MRKTIIISLDALGSSDREVFEGLEGFKYLIENGAYVKNLRSVYPSLTYPCHASIVTGRYPCDHGVVNNLHLQPSLDKKDWYWYEKDIEGDTIFRAAKRKGLRLGAVLWPVTASGNFDCLIPEILPHGPIKSQALAVLASGSPLKIIEMEKKYGARRKGLSQPYLDEYVEGCLEDFILNEDLDIIAGHYTCVDAKKHTYGIGSHHVRDAIKSYDDRIIRLLNLLKNHDLDANLIFLSDHSQLEIHTGVKLNSFLNDLGHLTIKKGKIYKYKFYMQEAGGAAYIYSKKSIPEEDSKLYQDLVGLGKDLGFLEKIYTSQEAKEMGADPDCLFMLEAREAYHFIDGFEGQILEKTREDKLANHGYHPDRKDYGAVLFALGPDIKTTTIERADLIDIGPTISKLADLDLKGYRGQVIDIIK